MTLQWTAVAAFLYVEVGVLLVLCIPFISAQRWQKIFKFSLWDKIAPYWNKGFLTMIIILIVLFLDAIREVRKYSGAERTMSDKLHPNMFDHHHMKLFRAQRNLYISGFSLFLWLTLRRVISLINQLATVVGTGEALKVQAENANQAAKNYMEDNEQLKRALEGGNRGGNITNNENEKLRKEFNKLQDELKRTSDALTKSRGEVEAMKKQTEGLTREYDRLLQEHKQLLKRLDEKEDKKDQ
ncbi:B-cell receptor-associated protein 29 [Lepisosteus oculatus]|uniref:B-cell receptor-associated protein 29 n=1 Tax=Lepisosteus oculatus TaxID=7918 RepID=UPI003713B3A3